STGPLLVTQHNLTIEGPQSPVNGRGAVISGGNSTASTQETIDIKGDTNPTASLTLRNVSVRNNGFVGSNSQASVYVYGTGTLTVENSDLQGNSVPAVGGDFDTTITLRNTTVGFNAVGVLVQGTVHVFNTTVANNSSGVFLNGGAIDATNTIIA